MHENALWVLKVPADVLRSRMRAPERFCALSFDATRGPGALFTDYVRLLPQRLLEMEAAAREVVGQHIMDLLALAMEADERTLSSRSSSVKEAHLQRIEAFIRRNLQDPDLGPDIIAAACGISTRYLHQIFKGADTTVSRWIREQRLLACKQEVEAQGCRDTIADIAYRWGFADQAQFSRAYRAQFGLFAARGAGSQPWQCRLPLTGWLPCDIGPDQPRRLSAGFVFGTEKGRHLCMCRPSLRVLPFKYEQQVSPASGARRSGARSFAGPCWRQSLGPTIFAGSTC